MKDDLSANFINELSNLLYSKNWIELEPTECANTLFLTKQALAKHEKEREQYPPTESDMLQWVLNERIAQLNADKAARLIGQFGEEKGAEITGLYEQYVKDVQQPTQQQQTQLLQTPKPETVKPVNPKIEALKAEYDKISNDYNGWSNKDTRKANRSKLREIQNKMAQELPLAPGMFFYESWGYDQTNIDYLEVMEVSPTKKTAMCRMVGKKTVESYRGGSSVAPDNSYRGPTLFRLRISAYKDSITLNGSYPLSEDYWSQCKLADAADKSKTFTCPEISNCEPYNFWNEGAKSVRCEGCKHCYKKLEVSYRQASFSQYDHPLHETDSQYGH